MLFRKKCISERKVIEFYRRFRQRKACHLSTSVQFLILMAKRSVKLHLRTCSFKNNFFCSVQTCCRQKTLKNLNNLNRKLEFFATQRCWPFVYLNKKFSVDQERRDHTFKTYWSAKFMKAVRFCSNKKGTISFYRLFVDKDCK